MNTNSREALNEVATVHQKNNGNAFYIYLTVFCALSWTLSIVDIPILRESIARNWLFFTVFLAMPLTRNRNYFSGSTKLVNHLLIIAALIFHSYLAYSILGYSTEDPVSLLMIVSTFSGYLFIAFTALKTANKYDRDYKLFS